MKSLAIRTKNDILEKEKNLSDEVLQFVKEGIINTYKAETRADMLFGLSKITSRAYYIQFKEYDDNDLMRILEKLHFNAKCIKDGLYCITFNQNGDHEKFVCEITKEVDEFYNEETKSANEAISIFFDKVASQDYKYNIDGANNIILSVNMPVPVLHYKQFSSIVKKVLREHNFIVLNLYSTYSINSSEEKSLWEVKLTC